MQRMMLQDLPGDPILGNLLEMRKDRARFLLRVAQEHGDVVRARVGFVTLLIASSADLAHETLVEKNEDFEKGYGLSFFARPLLGNGLLTSEGDFHARQRRLVAPAFVHKRIAEYGDVIAAAADGSRRRFRDGAHGRLSPRR